MRRVQAFCVVVAMALVSWPQVTQGQRGPTRSGDLDAFQGDRVRVIVQADDRGLSGVVRRHVRGLRRQVSGAAALELTRAEFEALARDTSVSHISKDLPVVADMAVTNKVTRADSVWAGTSGLLGIGSTSGYKGSGIGVAVLDSGIAPHSAIGSQIGRAHV